MFAAPEGDGWRVRCFAPVMDIPSAVTRSWPSARRSREQGDGVFPLTLNEGHVTMEGRRDAQKLHAALQSTPTRTGAVSDALTTEVLTLFSYASDDLDPRLPPVIARAGARHLIMALSSRERSARTHYDLEARRRLMAGADLCTVSLLYAETTRRFHARNRFAAAGSTRIPLQARPPRPWPATCATWTGHSEARSRSGRGRTWARPAACRQPSHLRPAQASGSPGVRG